MKRTRRKILLTSMMLSVCFSIWSAKSVAYEYDKAGNRISRQYVVELTTKAANTNEEKDSTGVEASLGTFKATVYPNPVKESLRVNLSNVEEAHEVDMRLYDSVGTLIENVQGVKGTALIEMSSYADGIYLLWIRYKKETLKFKIIKE